MSANALSTDRARMLAQARSGSDKQRERTINICDERADALEAMVPSWRSLIDSWRADAAEVRSYEVRPA